MLSRLRSLLFVAVAGIAAVAVGACARNPATGQSDLSLVSPAREQQIGDEAHPQVVAQFGVYEEVPELNAYVATIASRLHSVSEMSGQAFRFTLLDSDMVNAFAIPGGYVYVTRGLMALANSEAELAGVIGHEIGHITARHGARRITRQTLAGLSILGFGIATRDRNLMEAASVGAAAWLAGYGRSQELESDELGVRYLTRAGYDPLAMATFLEQLGRDSALSRKIAFQENQPDPADSWFATHPRTEDRVVAAAELARADLPNPFEGRKEYLQQIDGMIWGDSPAQGFRRGRNFSHPELRFSFDVPEGFRMLNSPSEVIAFNADGASLIFDGTANQSGSMAAYAQSWANRAFGRSVSLNDLEAIDINGMAAGTGWTTVPRQQGSVDVRFLAIRYDSSTIYRFIFVTPSASAAMLNEAFRRTTYSFRKLSSSEAAALRPLRIRIDEVRAGDTIATFAALMQFDNLQRERFMVLNAITSEADLQPGMLVKVIRE
ncbi:MAG: M48 family metalloprotease [Rhodospirillales bacterium]|nr:M48 family metalloprotease [Rhodospirillales bacterium]